MNRILLLEDDISLIDGLKYSLEKNGFSLNIVNTISQAMESFAKNPKYDLLLLDLTLTEQDLKYANMSEIQEILFPLFFLPLLMKR